MPPEELGFHQSLEHKREHGVADSALISLNACTGKEQGRYLFGQQLLAQGVKRDELPSKDPSVEEALGHQHDFTDQLKVWHHHGTGSGDGDRPEPEGRHRRTGTRVDKYLNRALRFSGSSVLPA